MMSPASYLGRWQGLSLPVKGRWPGCGNLNSNVTSSALSHPKAAVPSPPSIQSSNRDNMATKTAPQSNDLKFLGPMVDYTADMSNKGYDVASAIMQKMPQPVQQASNTAGQYSEKYITPVSQQVTGLLGNCVKTVDSSLDSVYSKNGKYREQLDPYVHRFVEARDVYIKKAESSLDYIREKVPAAGQALQEQMHKGITELKRLASEPLGPEVTKKTEAAISYVDTTYQKLISTPAVKSVLDRTKPASDNLWAKYNAMLHDPVVSMPLYHWAYNTSYSTLNWFQQTPLYSLPKAYAYPYVAPMADPVLKKVTSTDVYKIAVDQLQPKKH